MSKPLFFTGRRELARSDVKAKLQLHKGQPAVELRIDLADKKLPPDAEVVLEAYHTAYFERFPLGLAGAVGKQHLVDLTQLAPGDKPRFRLKVVARNPETPDRLLAAIDEIAPENDEFSGSIGSMLPVAPKTRLEMGDEFWRVVFGEFGSEKAPELWLNRDVRGLLAAVANQNAAITALIMPQILRQVLLGYLLDPEFEDTDEGRLGSWLRFARHLDPDVPTMDTDDTVENAQAAVAWVDRVVGAFAREQKLFAKYHAHLGADDRGDGDDD